MTGPDERGWLEPDKDFDQIEQEWELLELGGFHLVDDEPELEIFDELETMDEETFYDLARKLEEEEES